MVKIRLFVPPKIVFSITMEVMIKMTIKPPDYILAIPVENKIPEVMACCDKQDFDELKGLREKGMYIYKLVNK